MKKKNNPYISILLFFFVCFYAIHTNAQDEVYNPNKKFSVKELQEDVNVLYESLLSVHPGITAFLTKDSLRNIIDQSHNNLKDSLTEQQFHIFIRNVLAQFGCGHTVAMPSSAFYAHYKSKKVLLPFDVFFIENKLIVRKNYSNNAQLTYGEIISINNIAASEIINNMLKIQQKDGFHNSYAFYSIQKNFRTYFLFLYGPSHKFEIVYKSPGDSLINCTIDAVNNQSEMFRYKFDTTNYQLIYKTTKAKLFIDKKVKNLAILQINEFQQKKFKEFYSLVFTYLKNKKIDKLVIDLRNNGGGYFPNANLLLTFLINEKFEMCFNRPKNVHLEKNYLSWDFFSKLTKRLLYLKPDFKQEKGLRSFVFKYKPQQKLFYNNRVFLLINGGTFSMSSYSAAYLKDKTTAVIIGEESGGCEIGSNAILMPKLELPNTKIRISLPFFRVLHQVNLPKTNKGVVPHINCIYSVNDRLNNIDLEMNEVYKLIK